MCDVYVCHSVIQTALAGTALNSSIESLREQYQGKFVFVGIDKVSHSNHPVHAIAIQFAAKLIHREQIHKSLRAISAERCSVSFSNYDHPHSRLRCNCSGGEHTACL